MADTPPLVSSEVTAPELSNAEKQARLRKERREAKIKAGGSARLNKITGLGGGIQREPPKAPEGHADPDEIDISNHYYEPATTSRPKIAPPSSGHQDQLDGDALRQMMLNPFDSAAAPPGGGSQQNPFAGFPGMGGMPGTEGAPDPNDPIMKMLQQMMGGMPQEGANGMPSFPGMEGFSTGFPGTPGATAAEAGDPNAYLWRIVHALFALGLGLYIALTTPFSGTWVERERSGLGYIGIEDSSQATFKHFFWIFATTEVLLQSSRFFLEKGKVVPTGILGMAVGFLPEPFKGYLTLFLRYSRIWTTVSTDAMSCVFVLGVCAWLKG